jgi:D-glycero-beta-D-manno-heptose-7-phosphate kinase
MNLTSLFSQFSSIKIGVVGDVMLDTYWWGQVERISPEAPVPVVAVANKESRIGGAGNVALNLVALDAPTTLFSVIGNDENGRALKKMLGTSGINTQYMMHHPERITTNKTRVICRNQQMMRLDEETTVEIDDETATTLIDTICQYIDKEQPQVMILEDYNKGVLSETIIAEVLLLCKKKGVITTVDPKRKNFFAFKGATIFKPNLKEIIEALGASNKVIDVHTLSQMHQQLALHLEHDISFITLSEKGVFYQQQKNDAVIVPSHVRNIADVSGAGDTVIAVASLVYAATKNTSLMAQIANIAGGLVCEEVGTSAINKALLLEECKNILYG